MPALKDTEVEVRIYGTPASKPNRAKLAKAVTVYLKKAKLTGAVMTSSKILQGRKPGSINKKKKSSKRKTATKKKR